jgi:uncharacterized protein (DUF302 family)
MEMQISPRIKHAGRLLFLMGMLALLPATPAMADVAKVVVTDLKYEVIVAEKIAIVRDMLISQLEANNYAIINVLNVQEGLQGRGIAAPPLQLIEFCNLTKTYTITRHVPSFEMFAPCRLALIEHDGKTTVMVQRPAHVLSLLASDKNLSDEGRASLRQFDDDLRAILNSLANGGF